MTKRHFGEVEGVPQGTAFPDRRALHDAGVHRPLQAGISGGGTDGADSVVVSGGYVDDEDHGDLIVYTGHGGNDPATRKQIADQELTVGNLGLALSCNEGYPVRVVRGAGGDPSHSPASGFRYDGLYTVESFWPEEGRDGYRIWRFRLERQAKAPRQAAIEASPAKRSEVTVQRIVRNTAVATSVKDMHNHRCQICGTRLDTVAGPYSEGAHIRPLGRPHDGPDTADNILCLCPNHHVLLDRLAIYIDDDFVVRWSATAEEVGPLRRLSAHPVATEHLVYQRELCIEAVRESFPSSLVESDVVTPAARPGDHSMS